MNTYNDNFSLYVDQISEPFPIWGVLVIVFGVAIGTNGALKAFTSNSPPLFNRENKPTRSARIKVRAFGYIYLVVGLGVALASSLITFPPGSSYDIATALDSPPGCTLIAKQVKGYEANNDSLLVHQVPDDQTRVRVDVSATCDNESAITALRGLDNTIAPLDQQPLSLH